MICYFPEPYEDELVYSQLARLYVQSGYPCYWYAAEDLFTSKKVRPDNEFINRYNDDVLQFLTKHISIENIIMKHTMFPYYGRFLPPERRKTAFTALVKQEGNYHALLPMPKNKGDTKRSMRYCGACVKADREKYGETYWHRIHQMQGINICPIHHCKLIDSDVLISGKASPSLTVAEEVVCESAEIPEQIDINIQFAEYVLSVFLSDMDMQSEVLAGDFLHSRMAGTKYRSVRGEQRNIALFHADFTDFYRELSDNHFTELWQIQKVFTNDRCNILEVCMMGMFLQIPPDELTHMRMPDRTQEELFDEQVHLLHSQGMKYPAIAKQLNASVNVVKPVGERRYGTYHKEPKKARKSGAKPKEWAQMDKDLLPAVRDTISHLKGDGITRPQRITRGKVEKALGLLPKQIDNLPGCKAEIEKNYISQHEYWAIEVVWAANIIIHTGEPFNWKHIRNLTNMKKQDLIACLPYVEKYADETLNERIKSCI